jgi:hypothetical protein
MGLFTSKKTDLAPTAKLNLDWSAANAETSLKEIYTRATDLADESINWYIHAKKAKKRGARTIRILSIFLGACAAILPTIGELFPNKDGTVYIRPGWTTVLLGIAGALLLLDRFFGYSSAWMRYIVAELQIRQINEEFQLDFETERANWQGAPPSKDQVNQMLARSKAFVSQVNTIIREETSIWVQEFQNTIQYLDDSIKAKPAVTEPGALNLTITNIKDLPGGWDLSINGSRTEHYEGSTAGKRNLTPGKHQIKVTAKQNEKILQAEKIVTIPAGGVCEEVLTLS